MDVVVPQLAMLAALCATLTTLERFNPHGDRYVASTRPERLTALRWFVIYLVHAPVVSWALNAALPTLRQAGGLPSQIAGADLPPAIQWILAAVVCDCSAYWLHRMMHHTPALWRFHAHHHRDTRLRWTATFRFHPVDAFIMRVGPVSVALLLGFPPTALAPYLTIAVVVTVFSHADIWTPGRGLSFVVATPSFHRRHHAFGADRHNFSLVFPLFDWVFSSVATESPGTTETTSTTPNARDRDRYGETRQRRPGPDGTVISDPHDPRGL